MNRSSSPRQFGLTARGRKISLSSIGQRDRCWAIRCRLRAEPACAGLHGLEPALYHLCCDIYAAADRHADLLGRDPRPLFAQEDDLRWTSAFSGVYLVRCTDPEPRLVQLSDARVLLLYRLDQQHLLCRLRPASIPCQISRNLLQAYSIARRAGRRSRRSSSRSQAYFFYNLFGIAPPPVHQHAVLFFFIARRRDISPRRGNTTSKSAKQRSCSKSSIPSATPAPARHQRGLSLFDEVKKASARNHLFRSACWPPGASQVITLPYFKSTFDNGEYIYMLVWGMAIFGRAIGGGIHYKIKLPVQHKVFHCPDGLCRHLAV